jgi:hypothetical protein
MPVEVYHAYGYVKKAPAVVNTRAGRLSAWKGELIQRVCDEVISGELARARTAETVKGFTLSLARQVLTGHMDVIATAEHVLLLRKSGKCPRLSCPLRIQ